MKKTIILLFVCWCTAGYAQTIADTITLKSNFKGFEFYHNNTEIKAKEVFVLMDNNDEAWEEFNSSREAYFFGSIFGILGSALIIYPFAASAINGNSNYGPAFAGLCFIGISIPIFRSYNKKTVSAVHIYNTGLQNPNKPEETNDLSFGTTENGVGIKLSF